MGVSTRSFFCPLHLQPVLINAGLFKGESYPIAEKLWRYGLYLPSGVGTTDEEIIFSAESLRKAIKDFAK
jgi:perosamine synthetase